MIAWMLWATAVTSLLALAAAVLEHGLRLLGRPGRLAWIGAAGGAVALMVWSRAMPVSPADRGAGAGALELIASDLLRDMAAAVPSAPGILARADAVLAATWLAASGLLLLTLMGGLWRLARRARTWPAAQLADGEVLLSDGFGPALVGILSPRIVVPRWALHLGADQLRMACMHEAEHRRRGDGLVLLGGALVTAVAPWNVGLWWIHGRLRAAVEMDCDARVLRAGAPPVAYGTLLLELSTRTRDVPRMIAAFARPRATLERRMTMIVRDTDATGWSRYGRAACGALLAGALVAGACAAPAPTAVSRPGAAEAELGQGPSVSAESATAPHEVRLQGARSDGSGHSSPIALDGEIVTDRPHLLMDGDMHLETADSATPPLVFVDGVRLPETGMSLESLDPDAIERIEVLKGGAATALFGEEAAGGVIQIHLKPGAVRR